MGRKLMDSEGKVTKVEVLIHFWAAKNEPKNCPLQPAYFLRLILLIANASAQFEKRK